MVFESADRTEGGVGVDGRHLDGRLAWLNNGSCRYEEALAAAEQGSHYPDDLGLATWAVVELIEAAVNLAGRRGPRGLSTSSQRRRWQAGATGSLELRPVVKH